MMAVLKSLSGNSSICVISVLTSVGCVRMQVQIFLVLCVMVVFS